MTKNRLPPLRNSICRIRCRVTGEKTTFKLGEAINMTSKKQAIIMQALMLFWVFAAFCSWPAVSGSLTGTAEKLIDERLQTDSLFKTAGSTPPTLTASKPASSNVDMFSSASVWTSKRPWPYLMLLHLSKGLTSTR